MDGEAGLKFFALAVVLAPIFRAARDERREVRGSGAERARGIEEQAAILAGDGQGSAAADELDAPVPFLLLAFAEEGHADLSGAGDVGSAAGIELHAFDFNCAEEAFALHFFADASGGQ